MIGQDEIDNIDVNHVIILDSDKAGDIYMENLYPIWVDCIVYTIEGKYPINQLLRQKVEVELQNSKKIKCILFGALAEKMPIASEIKLNMAPFLLKDCRRFFWHKPNFEFNNERICELIKAFCLWQDVERIQGYQYILQTFEPDSVQWFHEMLY